MFKVVAFSSFCNSRAVAVMNLPFVAVLIDLVGSTLRSGVVNTRSVWKDRAKRTLLVGLWSTLRVADRLLLLFAGLLVSQAIHGSSDLMAGLCSDALESTFLLFPSFVLC
jgi:hypothetical protein